MNNQLSDWAWLMENDPSFQPSITEIMAALRDDFGRANHMMPRGMTNADAWMARHGNPLLNMTAARELADEVLGEPVRWEITATAKKSKVRLRTPTTEWADAVAHSPSVAMIAALLNLEAQKGVFG